MIAGGLDVLTDAPVPSTEILDVASGVWRTGPSIGSGALVSGIYAND